MPLTTLNDFITLRGTYLSYLQAKGGNTSSNPSTKPTKDILKVATYYKSDGSFDHFDATNPNDEAFYLNPLTSQFVKLGISNSTLLRIAGTAFAEAYNISGTIAAIPFVVFNHYRMQKNSGYSTYGATWKIVHTLVSIRNGWTDDTYYKENKGYKAFFDSLVTNRSALMILAIASTCKADIRDTAVAAGQTPAFPDNANGGIGWHGYDFSLSTWRAYKECYQAGFHFTQTAHDIWNMGSYDNSANIGPNLAKKVVVPKKPKLQEQWRNDVKLSFKDQKYKWQSTAAFGSLKQGSVLYTIDPDYDRLYNDKRIIGEGNVSKGIKAYGGVVYKGEAAVDP